MGETSDCDYRTVILERLQRRDNVCNQFQALFVAYNELTEYVTNIARSRRLRTSSTDLLYEEANDRITELKAELSDLYRKKEQNDQQLIETNNRLSAVMHELSAITILKEECQKDNQLLKKKLSEQEAELTDLRTTNQHLNDEFFALQASYSSMEDKYRLIEEERNNLIDRIKILKEKQISWINEQNEKELESQRRRVQAEIESAARTIPGSDDKMFELVDALGDKITAEFIGDIIPNGCRFKLDYGDEVNDVVWHPSGNWAAAGGNDRKVRLYSLINNKLEKKAVLTGCNDSVLGVDFSAETNQVLGAGSDCAIRVWGCDDCTVRHSLTGHGNKVSSAKFFRSGQQVVSGSYDRTFKIWDLAAKKCIKTFFIGSLVLDITANDALNQVITGHHDRKLRFWDTRVSDAVRVVELANKINGLALSFDSASLLVSTRDETLSLIELRSYQTLHIYSADQYRTASEHCRCSISPGMDYIAAGSADGRIYVWDSKSTKLEKSLYKNGHERNVIAVAWHPRGNMIISADKAKGICLWTV